MARAYWLSANGTPAPCRNSARRGTGFTPSSGREPWADEPVTLTSTPPAPGVTSIENLPCAACWAMNGSRAFSSAAVTAAGSPPVMRAVAVCGIALAEAAPAIATMAGALPSVGWSAKRTVSAPDPFSATTAGYLLSSTMLYAGSVVCAW
ncbi:hypothetical protein D3C86_1420110 [compost metagenome]